MRGGAFLWMRAQPGQVCERDALSLAKAAKEGMEQRQRADAKLRKEASHSAGA